MDEIRNFTIRLSFSKKIGPKLLQSLLDEYSNVENLYENYRKGKLKNIEIANIDILEFSKGLQKHNIQFSCFWEDSYPSLLKECNDFPLLIYGVGNFSLLKNTNLISIVGTRGITSYGKSIIEGLIPNLKQHCVVSGMAYGVDAYTHQTCINNNVPTIAVLPFSCNEPTPKGNISIYRKMLSTDNLIISEFPPGHKVHNGLFPRRNRIIAGISSKTIVIEAGIKSGAIITADLAFNYNREVYAFSGTKYNPMSRGCNYLIKRHIAQLVEDASDIGILSTNNVNIELNKLERNIYYAILPEPKSVNELSKTLGLESDLILRICTKLEINGILNTDNQNKFYVS